VKNTSDKNSDQVPEFQRVFTHLRKVSKTEIDDKYENSNAKDCNLENSINSYRKNFSASTTERPRNFQKTSRPNFNNLQANVKTEVIQKSEKSSNDKKTTGHDSVTSSNSGDLFCRRSQSASDLDNGQNDKTPLASPNNQKTNCETR
jgi:hypothetical protein